MNNPVVAITDKVMRMIKSMIYLSMRVSYRQGATAEEVTGFLSEWAPEQRTVYHQGLVERLLSELQREGRVRQAGARWYPVGIGH